jgi:hypothetical protein
MGKPNPKNFTEEQAIAIALSQNCKCAVCGCKAGRIIISGNRSHIVWLLNIHHKKPKSALTKEDMEKHGTGGGIDNGCLVCLPCHDRIHAQDPELAHLRTRSHQEIGETEADLLNERNPKTSSN